MDAKTTGAFIAQLRKEKQLTQKELALLLKVSDKAVSRWETGKGFPDTGLLKPLSDELGVSVGELLSGQRIPKETLTQKTDQVLVSSMKHSGELKVIICGLCCLLAVVLIFCGILGAMALIPPSAVEFVNKSATTLYYRLGETTGGLVYTDFLSEEFDGGVEYRLSDGTQQYRFTTVPEISPEPVLTFLHVSGTGQLFGFAIGENTVIKANQDLGLARISLRDFLEENGFRWMHDSKTYGRPTLEYIDGQRCNWIPYVKDNVLINICITAGEGNRLMGYDIMLLRGNA